ncbi:MAG: CDP-glycerol glycerophosphotransferase family protein [Butyricicoccus porcorum]|nr:CDP-glycerol glycerophosphotransferase family protein [Butyricicoccus porcorum]MDD6987167.1 CDP-glycerol glycerophosphotransferase family protein [Butyricicoccus porcorum]MDY4483279.1 CDP-glycerol glycerophosphotransferase family protein [Butyricicoccus porcorum]
MSIGKKLQKGLAWTLGSVLPVKKNKIVFTSYYGRGYSDNPKAVADELLKRDEDLDLVWLANDPEKAGTPSGVRVVRYDTMAAIRELCTARVWVDNCRKGARHKKAGQYYMQTWHGFALKRIERDVADTLSKEDATYAAYAQRDSRQIDAIISDSTFMTKIYQQSFWYDGPVEQYGSPRNDILVHPPKDAKEKVYRALHLPEGSNLVMYAPTFRADGSLDAYSLDYHAVCAACEKRFGGKWIALVRLHPHVMQRAKDLHFDNKTTFDATAFDDMQLLLSACDAVITDYSSLMFDFALTRRPCFQFATDIDAYKNDRNFYFPIDDTPFPLAKSNEEMMQHIAAFDEAEYQRDCAAFFEKMGFCVDGKASARCADWILERVKGNP